MCTKRKYDKKDAQTFLNTVANGLKRFSIRKENRKYYCMDCDAWHVTSMEEPSFEIRTEEISNDQFKKYLQ